MGLFSASTQAHVPSREAANLQTAACTNVAINYPRSHRGPAPEGRQQQHVAPHRSPAQAINPC